MPTTIVTEKDFVVIDQGEHGYYTPHIFASKKQFAAWQRIHKYARFVPRGQAKGRAKPAIDHRQEIVFVEGYDATPIEVHNVLTRARNLDCVFFGWRRDTHRAGALFTGSDVAHRFLADLTEIGCAAQRQPTKVQGKPWSQLTLIVIEHCDIPDRAQDVFFGPATLADVRLQHALSMV